MKFRLQNITLVVLSRIYALYRGRSREHCICPKKIVIVQPAKLGDMVCTTPMFRAVKKAYPKGFLVVIGSGSLNGELLEHNADVDEYIDASLLTPMKLVWKLRDLRPNFGCVTTPDPALLAALFLSGVPCIAAPNVRGGRVLMSRLYRHLLNVVVTKDHRMGHYAPREYLRLLEPIGIISTELKKHLAHSVDAEQKASELLTMHGKPRVGIAPGAGNIVKLWDDQKFAKVARFCLNKYMATVVLIGGPADKPYAKKLSCHLRESKRVTNVVGSLSIDELKALISHLDLFISVDTGPIYIAEAYEVPTIDIVGPVDEREQPPQGEKHLIVVANRAKPELHVMNARLYNEREARRQSETISAEMVIAKVDELLSKS